MTKILVIEDEELVRENILELLQAEGFNPIPACSGRSGVQLAQQHKPHLIICDIMMPEIDGYGVLRQLRQNPATARIPFIFLTAKGNITDFRQGMNLGADDYLAKPYEPAELLGAIATRLEKQAVSARYYASEPVSLSNCATQNLNRLKLASSLDRAIERQQLEVYYQPQVSLKTGQIIGAEALLRWHHPERGLVSPVEFIPVAEETGAIVPLSEWVLQTACTQVSNWQKRFFHDFSSLQLAVNISAVHFNQKNFTETITKILRKTNFKPEKLEIELTESTLIQDIETAIQIMSRLKKTGIEISIDDFGTGYSCLKYLQNLPFDTLKIDRCFITEITSNPKNSAITKAIIEIARSLNLKVIAEGVETELELEFVEQQGCDAIQGYLFSRPLAAEEFEKLLIYRKSLPLACLIQL